MGCGSIIQQLITKNLRELLTTAVNAAFLLWSVSQTNLATSHSYDYPVALLNNVEMQKERRPADIMDVEGDPGVDTELMLQLI